METQASQTTVILIVGFLTVLFIAIGVILIIVHRRNRRKAEESMSWTETVATVKESKVTQSSSMLMSSDEGESTPVFIPEISYTFQVGGNEYTSKRLTFAGTKSYSKREEAEKAASQYPVGAQLTVYYDPKNPKEAVLDRTSKVSNLVLIFGIMFIIIGVITVVIGALVLL